MSRSTFDTLWLNFCILIHDKSLYTVINFSGVVAGGGGGQPPPVTIFLGDAKIPNCQCEILYKIYAEYVKYVKSGLSTNSKIVVILAFF